jgi:hypothetical protein
MEFKMKKFSISLFLLAAIAVGSAFVLSTASKADDSLESIANEAAIVTETLPCKFPDDLECPLTQEQKALLDLPHEVSEDALKIIFPEE